MTTATDPDRTPLELRFHQPSPRRLSGRRLAALTLLVAALTLVGGQIGYVLSQVLTPVWQARAEIEYRGNSWTETENVAIQSRNLTLPIASDYGVEIREFEEDLRAGLVAGTQILRIEYFDTDADVALAVVDELAESYIADATELPPESARTLLEVQRDQLQTDLDAAREELFRQAPEPGVPLTAEQQDLQADIAGLRNRLGVIELRILDAELEEETVAERGVPRYVTRPFVFEEAAFPRPTIFTAVGLAIGLLLGMAIVGWQVSRSR